MRLTDDKILFAKVREGAVIPTKRTEDAGYDIFCCFNGGMVIPPHTTKLIPTGVAVAMSDNWCFILKERSSTSKFSIDIMSSVIDSGYRGEIFVSWHNNGDTPILLCDDPETFKIYLKEDFLIYDKKKAIVQGLFVEVPKLNIQEVTYEELLQVESVRGTNCLGSTNL